MDTSTHQFTNSFIAGTLLEVSGQLHRCECHGNVVDGVSGLETSGEMV